MGRPKPPTDDSGLPYGLDDSRMIDTGRRSRVVARDVLELLDALGAERSARETGQRHGGVVARPSGSRGRPSEEDERLVVVLDHAVLQMQFDGTGEHSRSMSRPIRSSSAALWR